MTPLLSFLAPARLWLLLLIPLLVLLYLWMVQRKRNRSKQVSKTMFDLVIPRDRTWLRHLAVGLSILSLLTLTVAFAKPKDQVSVPRERATIVVTIDGRPFDVEARRSSDLALVISTMNGVQQPGGVATDKTNGPKDFRSSQEVRHVFVTPAGAPGERAPRRRARACPRGVRGRRRRRRRGRRAAARRW